MKPTKVMDLMLSIIPIEDRNNITKSADFFSAEQNLKAWKEIPLYYSGL